MFIYFYTYTHRDTRVCAYKIFKAGSYVLKDFSSNCSLVKYTLYVPYSKCLGLEVFQILEFANTWDTLGIRHKSKDKIRLCFVNTLYTYPEDNFIQYVYF